MIARRAFFNRNHWIAKCYPVVIRFNRGGGEVCPAIIDKTTKVHRGVFQPTGHFRVFVYVLNASLDLEPVALT